MTMDEMQRRKWWVLRTESGHVGSIPFGNGPQLVADPPPALPVGCRDFIRVRIVAAEQYAQLQAEIERLRAAVRLEVATHRELPWRDVPDSAVDSWVERAAELGVTGRLPKKARAT